MAYIATRNVAPEPRFLRIAWDYKAAGEAWHVRWDYAFFQMLVETNFLLFRRGDGRFGDVSPRQNNFAGLGTTGGGVPGDSYPDVRTGVLAQIQHLVVYSGEHIQNPVGARTRLKQDDILSGISKVSRRRAVTFGDLAGRWAADRRYGRTIERIAQRFNEQFCTRNEPPRMAAKSTGRRWHAGAASPPPPVPAQRPLQTRRAMADLPPQAAASRSPADVAAAAGRPNVSADTNRGCRIQVASYGGSKAVLIRAVVGGETQYTALRVLPGFEHELSRNFIAAHAPGGTTVGEFNSSDAALRRAYELCRQYAQPG
ncbi:MAG: hypothetical protein AB7O43_03380 [Hyphomicrobiaceae bacterium]